MSIENIIIEDTDTLQQKAIKTALLFAGQPTELEKQLKKLNTTYTKVNKGLKVIYILRSKNFGVCKVTL